MIRILFLLAALSAYTQTPEILPREHLADETSKKKEDVAAPSTNQKPQDAAAAPIYNIDLPTGTETQPIYSTKDMTFNIGSTRIGFYGFIKADYLGENRITGDTADVILNNVPLNTDYPDIHTQSLIDARSSRLGFKVEDVFNQVLMKGAVEGDFSNSLGNAIQSNSRYFRLRLAYMSAELPSHFFFLFGQYYALPMHYPEIDMPTRINLLHYPAACIDARQPQFRLGYKQYFTDTRLLQYEINAETQGYNTTGIVSAEGGDTAQASYQKLPLFNAKITWISDPFKWDVSFSATNAYAVTNSAGNRVDAAAWGVVSNASLKIKNLILWGTAHHLVGLTGLSSNYFSQMTLINHSTKLKMAEADGACGALRYDFWKGVVWTDIMYGVEHVKEIPGTIFSGNRLKKIEDFRVNLVAFFWKHWQIGAEYERTYVKAYNGVTGCDNMFHIGCSYIFGQP